MFGARLLSLLAVAEYTLAHTVITYPGWRGDNLHATGVSPNINPNTVGVDFAENGTAEFPWGMQWIYPCGGMPMSGESNRTFWPVTGGALGFQPGWFPGHSKALIYVNIGIQGPGDIAPPNMSHPVVPPFQILGPDNTYYPGSVCLPQIGMPANLSLQVGQNITLQLIETAQHGAALYNCVDLTLVDPLDPRIIPVTEDNCQNTSNIGFASMFTTSSLQATNDASSAFATSTTAVLLAFAAMIATML